MFLRCGILREYSSVFILLLRLADVIANLTHNLRRQQVQALEVCQGNAGPSSSFLDPHAGRGGAPPLGHSKANSACSWGCLSPCSVGMWVRFDSAWRLHKRRAPQAAAMLPEVSR